MQFNLLIRPRSIHPGNRFGQDGRSGGWALAVLVALDSLSLKRYCCGLHIGLCLYYPGFHIISRAIRDYRSCNDTVGAPDTG